MNRRRLIRIALILMLGYAGLVTLFESLLGYYQPDGNGTMLITTYDADGNGHDRVVARLESEGRLYVAANHWPRAWYRRALANPVMTVTVGTEVNEYAVIRVSGAEHEQIDAQYPLGPVFRFLTGFPPRYFVRLEARPSS